MQCHLLPVDHMERCDETAFYNVTHLLLVIRCDEVVGHGLQDHSLAVSHRTRCDETATFHKNVQFHSQSVGHGEIFDETAFHKHMQCHPQAVGHRKRCDETAYHKMCNVTHILLVVDKDMMTHETAANVTHKLFVIGEHVMRLPFTKMCNLSLTACCL